MNDAMNGPPLILVLPLFPTPDTGSGQRSVVLLDAAALIGPVHVAVLADTLPQNARQLLPQAASITALGTWDAGKHETFSLRRLLPPSILRLMAPERFSRPFPHLKQGLEALIRDTGARVVLFRFFRAFYSTGLSRRDGLVLAVDVDDRDDQAYGARLARMYGQRAVRSGPLKFALGRLARAMKARLADASLVWFVAPEDVWTIPGTRTILLPNVASKAPPGPMPVPSQGDSVLFVGIYGHLPNRDGIEWFLRNCWADLSRRIPDVRLRIVGRGIHWPRMASRFAHLDRVDFVGPVDDLAAEYARARLCICPVREGGGSKIKVVEAAAFGRPIVGVPHAFRGFGHGITELAIEAASPEAFVEGCTRFLADGALADSKGAALAEWQKRHYSREASIDQIRADLLPVMV